MSIATQFVPGQAKREDKPAYPSNALREPIVNALVHRDYASFSGAFTISIYPNRIEFWNSRKLPECLTPKKLELTQHDSYLINPDIGYVFFLRGVRERIGRGTYNIVRECRQAGMRTPEWKQHSGGVLLTLFAGQDVKPDLNERQQQLISAIAASDQITTSDYISRFAEKLSPRQARRELEKLEDMGFLTRVGAGRGTVFTRTIKNLE